MKLKEHIGKKAVRIIRTVTFLFCVLMCVVSIIFIGYVLYLYHIGKSFDVILPEILLQVFCILGYIIVIAYTAMFVKEKSIDEE